MRLSYLELKNYRRFKELKLQFPDGVVGILGLNGVGKSTIIESVAWALFGNVDEVVRTGKEGVKSSGLPQSASCSAMLEFELGGAEYRVEREMGGKSLSMNAKLRTKETVLAEGDKPVRKMVEKLLGMDHKSFFTSVFARQKELNALQNVAPGERKKTVLRMLRIDGVDNVLTAVRADKNSAHSRIEGAERMLLTEDGREKQKVLHEKLPLLEAAYELAERASKEEEEKEARAAVSEAETRKRRDLLKKDADGFNSSIGELKSKESRLVELEAREKSISKKLGEATVKLRALPSLEKDDEAWKAVCIQKEALEREKARKEKASMIQQEIASEESEEMRRLKELSEIRAALGKPEQITSKIDETERAKSECMAKRAEISGRIGELKAKTAERQDSAKKDKKKLEEILAAGKAGTCPTCERTLEEAYELLVRKLEESIASAEKEAGVALTEIAEHERGLRELLSKESALGKRRAALDGELKKHSQLEAAAEGKETELSSLRTKLVTRKKALAEFGPVTFSAEEYSRMTIEHERLKAAHDRYLELKTVATQADGYSREIEDLRGSVAKCRGEVETRKQMVAQLEPKKSAYEAVIHELDLKTAELNSAKDAARRLGSAKDKGHSELDRAKKELEEVARKRKEIEEDRRKEDDLALLEDIVVNFKDDLIGRIAPALSELAAKGLESMTGGRYTQVELDENYELQVEDQGEMYPLSRFSGGESDLANLCLRLAISRIIADRTGASPVNLLILDEIFGSQDLNRKRSVMNALSRLSGQFRQIFLITHIEDVKDSLNYVIRVEEREDGTSTASLAA